MFEIFKLLNDIDANYYTLYYINIFCPTLVKKTVVKQTSAQREKRKRSRPPPPQPLFIFLFLWDWKN